MTIEVRILSPQRRMRLFMGWREAFSNRIYQWAVVLSFGSDEGYHITFERAKKMVITWIRDLEASENMWIGCFFAICRKNGRVHVHLLMIGEGRYHRLRKTLLDVNVRHARRMWRFKSDIDLVRSQEDAIIYLAAQQLKNATCEMEFYNPSLLRRSLVEPYRGPCIGAGEDETLDEE